MHGPIEKDASVEPGTAQPRLLLSEWTHRVGYLPVDPMGTA